MKQFGYLGIVLLLLGLLPAALPKGPVKIAEAQPANAAPRRVTVLAGAGQDAVDLVAFLPEKVRIRVGDTVTWKMEGDLHTVSFTTGSKPAGLVIPSSQAPPGEVLPRIPLPVPGGPRGGI
jgi:hypothetical protein